MPSWRSLDRNERQLVFAAALLHDVAKPLVTREEDGRIRSRGHTVMGARVARRILMEDPAFGPAGLSFCDREQIVSLVRHHGLPPIIFEKTDPPRALITTSMTARLDLLGILAEADVRGRKMRGRDNAIDRVQLFSEYYAEYGCIASPYQFFSDHSRFHYFRNAGAVSTQEVYDASKFQVTLLSGLPASGKDGWIRRNAGDVPVIALDQLRAELEVEPGENQLRVIESAKESAKKYLRLERSFIWNATNTRPADSATA